MSRLLLILPLLALACAPNDAAPNGGLRVLGRQANAIIGGVDAPDDIAVVELVTNNSGFCTGTLVGAKTIITAAHCLDDVANPAGYAARFWEKSGQSYTQFDVTFAAAMPHPLYDGVSQAYDVGIVRLVADPSRPAARLVPHPIDSSYVGKPVRHVGYGQGSAARDQVTYAIRQVTADAIESAAPGKNTCFGDSGGPAFVRPDGGTDEFLIGVVSWGDANCSQIGWDQRVDIHSQWILSNKAQWEVPTCDFDYLCKPGCPTEDIDCACALDGVCNPSCGGLTPDSDCANCGPNGVCSTVACPEPEPESDCRPDGEPCPNTSQCKGGECTSDAQHSLYCTRACTDSSQCTNGMQCDQGFCKFKLRRERDLGQSCTAEDLCIGFLSVCAPDGFCRNKCGNGTNCFGAGETCVNETYCAPAPVVDAGTPVLKEEPQPEPEKPEEKKGCSAAPSSLALFMLPLVLRGLRRGRKQKAKR